FRVPTMWARATLSLVGRPADPLPPLPSDDVVDGGDSPAPHEEATTNLVQGGVPHGAERRERAHARGRARAHLQGRVGVGAQAPTTDGPPGVARSGRAPVRAAGGD